MKEVPSLMIVQENTPPRQALFTPRRKRREIEKSKCRLEKKLRKINLPVEFTNGTTSQFANFHLIEAFKEAIGFKELVRQVLTENKAPNCLYQTHQMLDYFIDAQCLGLSRFEHIASLRYDPGYLKIKGDLTGFPEESSFRRFLNTNTETLLEELRTINQKLIEMRAQTSEPKEITIDCDDTVVTLHGNQADGKVGYNPKYKGRASIKLKAAFIAETSELIASKAYDGDTHSNGGFPEFLNMVEDTLPHKYVLKYLRLDKGFFAQDNFEYFEDRTLSYVCKAPMRGGLKKVVKYLHEENLWEELDDYTSVAELTIPLLSWSKARRFVFICQKKDPETEQLYLSHPEFYSHQAIVTNIEADEMEPEEIWHYYNKRGTCELLINELKEGFAADEASQNTFDKNEAYMLIKSISYNLMLWFKEVTMPKECKSYRATTIRRKVLCVPGNIVGNGRYRHIKLAANMWLERVIKQAKLNLDNFLYTVIEKLTPLDCWLNNCN